VGFNYGEYYQNRDGSIGGAADVHHDVIEQKAALSIKLNLNKEIQGIEVIEIG
jgi:hypothetical protein